MKFAGFEDFIEIFSAGKQTDSAGNEREWTEADLDQIIANHNAEHPAPAVVGHPKTDAPAYGWVESLKRSGKKLLAKFAQVEPKFADMVKEGRFRNRSVSLLPGEKGWTLRHVGFLGAAAPAVAGLKPIAFDAGDKAINFEFGFRDSWVLRSIARGQQRLREFIIEKFGVEAADRLMPLYEVESLTTAAAELEAKTDAMPRFTQPDPDLKQEPTVPKPEDKIFTQADLDAAADKARTESRTRVQELEFSQRVTTARNDVQAHVSAGRLTPAQAEGAAEFLAQLDGNAVEIEFTASDGKTPAKKKPAAWFRELLGKLPVQIKAGAVIAPNADEPAASFAVPTGFTVNPAAVKTHEEALAYMAKHKSTDYIAAVKAVQAAA